MSEGGRRKEVGGGQQAVGRKQRAAQSGSAFTTYCLLPTAFCLSPTAFFLFSRLGVTVSPTGRALLAGALLISAYVLVRYWRCLAGRSRKIRLTLVGLRAVTLVLVSLALSGLEVEYEGAARARVLLSSSRGVLTGAEREKANGLDERLSSQLTAALRAEGFEVTSESESGDAAGDDEELMAAALLSDGAMSSTEARREVERASERVGGAPVYVFADLPENAGASVALENVTVLGRALRGVPVSVRCDVHARGMRGRESLVTISDDAKAQTSARVAWIEDDERRAVTLTLVPKVAGWIDYSAKVEAAGGEENSSLLSRPFSLYVEERRLRVLFFESEPTWEAKFVRRALEQTGIFEVDYFAQVSRAATVGLSEEAGERKQPDEDAGQKEEDKSERAANAPEAKLHAALRSAAQLNQYDCVLVGATENSLLSSAEIANLGAWVERRGGGLIVLGGNGFSGSIAAPGGNLYSLLPAEISAQSFSTQAAMVSQGRPLEAEKTRESLMLTPTEAGAGGALAGYLRAVEDAQTKPALLTGQGLKLGALRPGASVLAVAGQPDATGTSETGTALIAARRDGEGRALLFAPADSWRMRAGEAGGEEEQAGGAFNTLWQGLVLWASAGARPAVEISLSDDSPAAGSAVTVEIRARDNTTFSPQKIEKLNARLQPLAGDKGDSAAAAQSQEIAFAPEASDPSVWRARLTLRAAGRYALEIDYAVGGRKGSVEKFLSVVAPRVEETGAAFDTLRRAARATGGDMLTPAQVNVMTGRLSATSRNSEIVRREWQMRAWWPLAFIIPLLLSAEWFARRWWKED